MTDRSRLLRLLVMIQSAEKNLPDGYWERTAEVFPPSDPVPPDRFLGRRMIAWVKEREQRRLARKRGRQHD